MTLNLYRITENHYHISVATWLGNNEWVSFDEVPISIIDNIKLAAIIGRVNNQPIAFLARK